MVLSAEKRVRSTLPRHITSDLEEYRFFEVRAIKTQQTHEELVNSLHLKT